MDIPTQYKTATSHNSQFNIREYVTPVQHVDPRKQILDRQNADYKNKPKQGKFKATKKHKPCYLDEHIEPFVPNPSPDKYKTTAREGFFGDADNKDKKLKRNKSADALRKVDPNLKRGTYIDDIQFYAKKHKPPGVGKFDITKDPYKRKFIHLKTKQPPIKLSNMDDIKFISAGIPGSGNYNPHKSVPHLRPDRTDYNFYKAKHREEERKRSKHISTKVGPSSYNPVSANTFDSIAKNKDKERSRWSHGEIDVRKGLKSKYKSPSPAEYNLLNQWTTTKSREKESQLGKVKLFERTSRSVKAFSVYH